MATFAPLRWSPRDPVDIADVITAAATWIDGKEELDEQTMATFEVIYYTLMWVAGEDRRMNDQALELLQLLLKNGREIRLSRTVEN